MRSEVLPQILQGTGDALQFTTNLAKSRVQTRLSIPQLGDFGTKTVSHADDFGAQAVLPLCELGTQAIPHADDFGAQSVLRLCELGAEAIPRADRTPFRRFRAVRSATV